MQKFVFSRVHICTSAYPHLPALETAEKKAKTFLATPSVLAYYPPRPRRYLLGEARLFASQAIITGQVSGRQIHRQRRSVSVAIYIDHRIYCIERRMAQAGECRWHLSPLLPPPIQALACLNGGRHGDRHANIFWPGAAPALVSDFPWPNF
ncbi:hypothetical protein DL89DRAFT_21666 [Linderina pennispora]|uniref:Uncharacterized protein n=1 Tax=Linderina pennispora TaxID=61395 RepID=A0A1Y1WMV6_9FUNG|nr:uncharacterized protein DL89DRAFT_21666 [Linderina pennispora]ORX74705.1 hypothetical protein DL89DRAFT_21666 [Linderina pennispora]